MEKTKKISSRVNKAAGSCSSEAAGRVENFRTEKTLFPKEQELRLYVNGKWIEPSSKKYYEVTNPATGELLAKVPHASKEDVDLAVSAAREAFDKGPWQKMSPRERGAILHRIGALIEKHAEDLALLESRNNGKTLKEAKRGDLPPAAEIFHYMAGWADKYTGETLPVSGPYLNYTLREPVGVVGAIVPWNYPLLIACWKLAPALAMGNSVVLKPSEQTPLTALRFAELLEQEVDIPHGVINIVTGFGDTGAAISSHRGVDKVAFTGSVETARAILHASAESNLKRISLELGGKSPNIIFPDADFERATRAALWGVFANKGEVCSAGSRLFLHSEIYDRFLSHLLDKTRTLVVGDPLDPETDIGSLVSGEQLARVEQYVSTGLKEGAQLLCGGFRVIAGAASKGFFYQPTIFGHVTQKMTIAREEVFGPVLSVICFQTEEELIAMVNDTTYGLVSAVWTKDIERAHRMARQIDAGSVWINDYNCFDSASPFGGVKESGWGREMSHDALHEYTRVKSVWIHLG